MDSRSLLSVSETAEQLGVDRSRVLVLISTGRLPASRVGRDWFIGITDLSRFQHAHRRPGRPFTPARAWAVLTAAEHAGRVELPRSTATRDPFWLVNLVRKRATVRRLHVLDRLVANIADEVVAGGESAGRNIGFAPRDQRPMCDGYITASRVDTLIDRYALVDAAGDEINVIIRIVNDDIWPFTKNAQTVGPLIAAIDMLSDPTDDRSIECARPIVERYL
jgi:excisionase family DNA binding protein